MRGRGIVLAAVALAAVAPPVSAHPVEDRVATAAPGLPALPEAVETLAARQRQRGSNVMFAHLVVPPHRGYASSAFAYKRSPSARTFLTIAFARSAAADTQRQTSVFTWILPRGALRMDRDLRPASLTTRKSMGSNGSISMRLANRGRYGRARPQGCTSGSASVRIARFAGRFRVHLRDRFFRRIALGRARVVLYREHDLRCRGNDPPPPPCPQDLSFHAAEDEGDVAVGAFRTAEGKVDQTVVVARPSGRADAVHTISVTLAVPGSFEASEDLTTASVDGDAAGPWLGGDLSYVAPPAAAGEDERCGPHTQSSGIATGDYTAHFDAVGPVTPATTGVPATLRRES